jgi:hypothetical protein
MYQQDYDPPSDQVEVELVGSFLQEAHDIGECWDVTEPMHQVEWAHRVGESLRSIEAAGFRVFGIRTRRRVRLDYPAMGAAKSIPMFVATLIVIRADNPKILHADTEREHLAAVLTPDLSPHGRGCEGNQPLTSSKPAVPERLH